MFTGIIQQTGTVNEITRSEEVVKVVISFNSPINLKDGDSVNLNGICSTITEHTDKSFTVEFMPETLKRTTANNWHENYKVNIETALQLNDKLNGHLVMGHVDATGKITNIEEKDKTKEITITYPGKLARFIAFKGSVCIDGVSLTLSYLEDNSFSVSLIPYTIKNTILGAKKVNDTVNIEVDMISRYLKRLFDERDKQSNYEFLKDRGFI